MLADAINGMFELLAGFFILMHCRRLYIDKQVRGASIVATTFFTMWGFWNLYYYPSLEQWLSFYGGIAVVAANTLWVSMMAYYTWKEKYKTKVLLGDGFPPETRVIKETI